MADEAFALSPISARASLPGEEDYEAIREAFMETSRGRWFLGEYARRNRNADTRMVLDAVARIEEVLAAQRQPPPAEEKHAQALAAIRSAVTEAEQAASATLEGLGLEENLAPIRKGVRIIREISWRWREIGADGRICDLIDSQVNAIEAGCTQIAGIDPHSAVRAALDLIKSSIDRLADGLAEAPAPAHDAPDDAREPTGEAPLGQDIVILTEVEQEAADTFAVTDGPDELSAEDADAYDEAILDKVAIEMAAPDPDDLPEPQPTTGEVTELLPMEPMSAVVTRVPEVALEPALQISPPAVPQTLVEPSLGAAIIAEGIVPRPKPPASDPLAPIRRMSQAEKIAFFS
jgi:hypothetical protein